MDILCDNQDDLSGYIRINSIINGYELKASSIKDNLFNIRTVSSWRLGPTTQLFIVQRPLYSSYFTTLTLQLHSLYNCTHFTTALTLQLHSLYNCTHFTTLLNSLYNSTQLTLQLHSTHFTTRLTLQVKFLIKINIIHFQRVLFVFVRSQVRTYAYM